MQGNAGVGWASVKALTPQWLDEKKIKVLAQYKAPAAIRSCPTFRPCWSLRRDEPTGRPCSCCSREPNTARPYFLPPDVPAERVEALRRAFDATMKDQTFLAEAAKLQLEVSPMTGEEVQAMVADIGKTPADVVNSRAQRVGEVASCSADSVNRRA